MSRSRRSETIRLLLAREAKDIIDEELAAMDVKEPVLAQNRAATRLKINTRTLRRRLSEAPPEDNAALDLSNLVIDCGEY